MLTKDVVKAIPAMLVSISLGLNLIRNYEDLALKASSPLTSFCSVHSTLFTCNVSLGLYPLCESTLKCIEDVLKCCAMIHILQVTMISTYVAQRTRITHTETFVSLHTTCSHWYFGCISSDHEYSVPEEKTNVTHLRML